MVVVKDRYLDSFVVVVVNGVQISAKLADATQEQLKEIQKVMPDYFVSKKPDKAKAEED